MWEVMEVCTRTHRLRRYLISWLLSMAHNSRRRDGFGGICFDLECCLLEVGRMYICSFIHDAMGVPDNRWRGMRKGDIGRSPITATGCLTLSEKLSRQIFLSSARNILTDRLNANYRLSNPSRDLYMTRDHQSRDVS